MNNGRDHASVLGVNERQQEDVNMVKSIEDERDTISVFILRYISSNPRLLI